MQNLVDVMRAVDFYTEYLLARGVPLDQNGFPVLGKDRFLDRWPETVVPYKHRRAPFVKHSDKTVLCLFCADDLIYPRLSALDSDVKTYRSYLGVIGCDLTVTADMDYEWQAEIMLLNHLFTAALAVNGIKVIANLRCGDTRSQALLSVIPKGVMCASGFLGCRKASASSDLEYLSKVLALRPSKLLLYGKSDRIVEEQLDANGVCWRRYPDARRIYFAGR